MRPGIKIFIVIKGCQLSRNKFTNSNRIPIELGSDNAIVAETSDGMTLPVKMAVRDPNGTGPQDKTITTYAK